MDSEQSIAVLERDQKVAVVIAQSPAAGTTASTATPIALTVKV